jgi:Fe-S-cluster containining protein
MAKKKISQKRHVPYVPDDLSKVRFVDANDNIGFHCSRCGDCCRHVKDGVMLETLDAFRLAKLLRGSSETVKSIEDVLTGYAHPMHLLEDVSFPVFLMNTTDSSDKCVFLRDRRCTVQDAKPRACRLYPFGAGPTRHREFEYAVVSQKPHHFKGAAVRVGDWMDANMTSEDRAFVIEDTEASAQLIPLIRAQETAGMGAYALNMLLFFKYFNYDLDEPFMPQFTRNMASLRTALVRGAGDV